MRGWRPSLIFYLVAFLALLLVSQTANTAEVEPDSGINEESIWSRNARRMFKRDQPRIFARSPEDFLEYLDAGDGFYTQLSVTTIWQAASSSLTDRNDLLNVTYDFGGAWEILDAPASRGGFTWWVRGGTPIGAPSDADLSNDIGSLQGINGSLESDAIELRELQWVHGNGKNFRYSAGRIDPSFRYDFNAVANSEREQFIALPLSNSSSIPFPDPGVAADVFWEPGAGISVHLGVFQANCQNNSLCVDNLSSGEWFAPAELVLESDFAGLGTGNYRFLVYATESGGERGNGFSVSFDQQFGRVTPFMRLSTSDRNVTAFNRFASLGIGIAQPFGRIHDEFGLAWAKARPSDPALRDEQIIELYWRFYVNPFVTLTPDLQFVIDPANNPNKDRITVAGLRLQLDF